MAIVSTGPVENNAVAGIRPTQTVTVKLVKRDAVGSTAVSIQGYVLGVTRTLYVSEVIDMAPDEVVTRNYYADLDAFEFIFSTGEAGEEEIGISVWGKNSAGELVAAHRVAAHEKLNAGV